MHVSVLEAMACGCLVVGYPGVGGHTYMVGEGAAQNCVLVENGDLLALGQTLENVLRQMHANRAHYANIIQNGINTARPHQDAEAEASALTAFYQNVR
jgi:glycosyltransferase involved in cell wall biosynthesis